MFTFKIRKAEFGDVIITKNFYICNYPGLDVRVRNNAKIAKENVLKLQHENNLLRLMEPMYRNFGVCFNINNERYMEMLSPFNINCPGCDGIVANHEFLKINKAGLFMRTSDCASIVIIEPNNNAYILHASVESLNNGILLNLPKFSDGTIAIIGPSISSKNYYYSLDDKEKIKQRIGNFESLGYSKFTYTKENNIHISISNIILYALNKLNLKIIYNDKNDTFSNLTYGSNRRDGINRKENVMLVIPR